MTIQLAPLVDAAYDRAAALAAPFVPSHAQVALELQPVVNDVLALGKQRAIDEVFRGKLRPGTWDVHVLAECKSAWSLERAQ